MLWEENQELIVGGAKRNARLTLVDVVKNANDIIETRRNYAQRKVNSITAMDSG